MIEGKVVIVDYGVGNIKSVANAINKVSRLKVEVSDKAQSLKEADCIIMPGVGAFDDSMESLKATGLIPALEHEVFEMKKPILGICVGMQILFEKSEEGNQKGLCWIPGQVKHFQVDKLTVPHFGWNNIEIKEKQFLLESLPEDKNFYFAHSYHVETEDKYVLASCNYGYDFPVMVNKDNIWGMQFHPEKSHNNGLKVLSNFTQHVRENL